MTDYSFLSLYEVRNNLRKKFNLILSKRKAYQYKYLDYLIPIDQLIRLENVKKGLSYVEEKNSIDFKNPIKSQS